MGGAAHSIPFHSAEYHTPPLGQQRSLFASSIDVLLSGYELIFKWAVISCVWNGATQRALNCTSGLARVRKGMRNVAALKSYRVA